MAILTSFKGWVLWNQISAERSNELRSVAILDLIQVAEECEPLTRRSKLKSDSFEILVSRREEFSARSVFHVS